MSLPRLGLLAAASLFCLAGAASAQQSNMSFFVSTSNEKGADFGGLAGADALCQGLAQAAGAGGKTWHAYLSTQGAGAVNARDRIGKGPWVNAKGANIATDVTNLHSASNNLTKATTLDSKGNIVNGRGDTPNEHDIITGSSADGTTIAGNDDSTCGNYTKGGTEGAVMLGHSDRIGLRDDAESKSWNASHLSRGGCSLAALKGTGSAARLYCFATN